MLDPLDAPKKTAWRHRSTAPGDAPKVKPIRSPLGFFATGRAPSYNWLIPGHKKTGSRKGTLILEHS